MRRGSIVSWRRLHEHRSRAPLLQVARRSRGRKSIILGIRVRLRVVRGGRGFLGLLFAKFGEPDFVAGLITDIHRLPEAALRGDAVEGKYVDGNREDLDRYLDDGAHQDPVLLSTYEPVVDVVLEELAAVIVLARPAPQVLPARVIAALDKNSSSDSPHDDGEDEGANSKYRPVYRQLLRAVVPTPPVRVHDVERE